ncbi:GH13837 [Drosophila grimshawi]|uniref:GH13837 n=2 Tax=Drosophila grimshawi TaxID=7222 RepID=B4JR88_DROGR|nr:GH13837 [Drosophila grimshawi]
MTGAPPAGESLRELRKLLRQQQQQQQQQQQDEQQLQVRKFNEDINLWAQSLEQMGLSFVSFVEQCRPLGTRCTQRTVQRHLRTLRRSYSDLHAQLEILEISYVGKISEEEILTPTLRAVRGVLQQYDRMLRLINVEAYKLVEQ